LCPGKATINPQTFRQATSTLFRLNITREKIGFGKKFSRYYVRLNGAECLFVLGLFVTA